MKRALRVALDHATAVPGAVAALATAGDLINRNPHVHFIFSAGAWAGTGPDAAFLPWPQHLTAERLTELLRRAVLAMLQRRQRLTEQTAARLLSWEHSGFSVWCGEPVQPWETESRQRLARYLVKAPLSLERLDYDETRCRVVYTSNKRGQSRSMSALEFLGELSVHLPDRGSHGVLFYGRHSKRSRGERARLEAAREGVTTAATLGRSEDPDPDADPAFLRKRKAFRASWAALLKKVWDVDAMRYPRCASRISIVSAITDLSVAKRILRHLGLFDQARPPNPHDCPLVLPMDTDATLLLWPEPAPRFAPQTPEADPPSPENGGNQSAHQDWPADPPFIED